MTKDEFEKFRLSSEEKQLGEEAVKKSKGTKYETTKSKLLRDSYCKACKKLIRDIEKMDKEL